MDALEIQPHLCASRERDPQLAMVLAGTPPDSDQSSDEDELQWEPEEVPQVTRPQRRPPQQMQSSNAASRVIFSETNGHEFKREHMSIEVAVSGLAALLQKHEVPTMRIKIFGAPSSERNQALDLEIPTDANFVTVIAQVLGQSPGVAPSDPSAYQMLMADPDGDPDEELIPPRDKPVADLDWRDFALLPAPPHLAAAQEKSDRLIGNGHSMGGKAAGSEGGACSIRGGSSESVGFGHGSGGQGMIRVHLPREAFGQRLGQWVIKLPYRPDAFLSDVLLDVCWLQRVRLHPHRHTFVLPNGEQAPLDLSMRLRDLELPLSDAFEPEIKLVPKPYADGPQTLSFTADDGSGRPAYAPGRRNAGGGTAAAAVGGSGDLSRRDARAMPTAAGNAVDDVVFFPGEAILYKEYLVTKVNRFGARQERVLGIDNHKVHNLAVANAREDDKARSSFRDSALKLFGVRKAETGTKHRGWLMVDLLAVWLVGPEQPCEFCVVFKDLHEPRGRKEHRYEAETPQHAFEIVKKIEHIANQRNAFTERFQEGEGQSSPHQLGVHGAPASQPGRGRLLNGRL